MAKVELSFEEQHPALSPAFPNQGRVQVSLQKRFQGRNKIDEVQPQRSTWFTRFLQACYRNASGSHATLESIEV
jgi:hypothetical protein